MSTLEYEAGVPCGPILSIDQTFADPQVQHLGMTRTLRHPELGEVDVIPNAVNLSRTSGSIDRPTPGLGQHSDEVLGEYGFAPEEVAALRGAGVV